MDVLIIRIEKRFYEGRPEGLYNPLEFSEYMRKKRARIIEENTRTTGSAYLGVYHLNEQNVTLRYAATLSDVHGDAATVTLCGNKRGISDVEKSS